MASGPASARSFARRSGTRPATAWATTVAVDSLTAPVDGRISRILPLAAYPPSYHATDQVHLTRAVPVEVTLDAALPPGAPADLHLSSCQPKG